MTNTLSDIIQTCQTQVDQRARFFYHESGNPDSRFNVTSPYEYDSNGNLVYTPLQLNMRRKCEILKYNSETKGNENTKKNKYSYLSKLKKINVKDNPECNISLPTSSSNIPGPIIYLYEDPNVPLYKYGNENQTFKFSNIPFDDFKRILDSFPVFNNDVKNDNSTNIVDIVILNPNVDRFLFNFSVPICIQYNALYNKVNDGDESISNAVISIYSADLDVMYSSNLVEKFDVPFRTGTGEPNDITQSTKCIEINFSSSTDGAISFSQYIGNINVNNINLVTITQYVYSIFMKLSIDYAEYSSDLTKQTPVRTNTTGGNISNDDSNTLNITNVEYNFIINFDGINDSVKSSASNCSTLLYGGADDELVEPQDIQYKDYMFSYVPN